MQPAPDSRSLDQALADAVTRVAPSVLHIVRRRGGTAIAWPGTAADLVVTSSAHTPDHTRVGVPSQDDLEWREAEVIGRDPGTDVALLRVTGGGLAPAPLRECDGLAVGNLALAIGRPGRTARASLRVIGVLGPPFRTPWGGKLDRYVESDRAIPRGFSGGPLIDAAGAVIGMNTRALQPGADLAVPVATLRRVVDELVLHGKIRRGYLGVGAYPAHLPASFGGGHERGALVASLDDGGPAATAGVLVGDIIVELGGTPISGPDRLRLAIADRAGETLRLGLVRAGAPHTVELALGSRP
jgi:S1-C subfamily serine protease